MKKVRIIGLLLVLTLLCGCSIVIKPKTASKKDLEKTVTAAMDALTVGDVDKAVFLGVDGEPVSLSGNSGIAGKISALTTYEVVSVEGEGKSGKAVLDITTADAVQIVLDDLDMDIGEANPHVHEGNFQDNECYYIYVTVDGENMFYAVHKITGQILTIAKSDHSH
jgi:hypothetical protein